MACVIAFLLGCSTGEGTTGSAGALHVDVKGRKIVIPPPEGMADAIHRVRDRPRLDRGEMHIVAVYVPRDSIGEVNRPGFDPRWYFMAAVPSFDSDSEVENARTFARLSDDWYGTARRLSDSTTSHLAAELELVRAGLDQAMPLPGTPPANGWCLGTSSLLANAREMIVLLRGQRSPAEVFCHVRVLVRGRIVTLFFGGSVSSVQEIAEVAETGEKWMSAVVAANAAASTP